jgi:hypothetical protein
MKARVKYNRHYEGVTICERWQTSFANFLEDIGEVPEGLTLDRIDNSKGYSPDNVRLATPKQQANNRTNNVVITIDGITKTASEWADEAGLPRTTVYNRYKAGWKPEDCLLNEDTRNLHLTIDGVTKPRSVWAKENGIDHRTVAKRKARGWPDEDCIRPSQRPKK